MNSIDPRLKSVLQSVALRRQRLLLWSKLAACWAGAAFIGLGLIALQRQLGWTTSLALPLVAALGFAAALIVWLRQSRTESELHELARQIEAQHPNLDGRLLTAVQQEGKDGGTLNYLQDRVVSESLAMNQQHS